MPNYNNLSLAHRNVHAHACADCAAAARQLCEPYCPSSLGVEFITLEEGYLDALICVAECGNQCHFDGFVPVLADGTPDDHSDRWVADGKLIGCCSCGRVFSEQAVLGDGEHAQVLFRLDSPPSFE